MSRRVSVLLTVMAQSDKTSHESLKWSERNLLLFLHPFGEKGEKHSELYRFPRRRLLGYVINPVIRWLRGRKGTVRKILFVNEGIQSCYFDARGKHCYRVFAKRHIPNPRGLRERMISLLPLALRAQERFIIVSSEQNRSPHAPGEFPDDLKYDFMFFHNANGKLMMANCETILGGSGKLLKTTANPEYARTMEKEYETIKRISKRLGKSGYIPEIDDRFEVDGRICLTEEYIHGQNLRCVFNNLARERDIAKACKLIDRLDEWYGTYFSSFKGEKRPLSSFYSSLFKVFSKLYSGEEDILATVGSMIRFLDRLSRSHPGVVPVDSHNDLWPGNFVERPEGLTAVDWERATEDRAPMFDYYWLITSAALEYMAGRIGCPDYSHAFRLFLEREDAVCRHAHERLELFLERMGLEKKTHPQFLLLFLMEWSVQGYQVLGERTTMDKLAFNEFNKYRTILRENDN